MLSEKSDLTEPTLLNGPIRHIGSLASVYYKPPNAPVEGSHGLHCKHLPVHHRNTDAGSSPVGTVTAIKQNSLGLSPSQGVLRGLLNLDLGPPVNVTQVSSMQMGAVDLLAVTLVGGKGGSPAVGQSFIPSSMCVTSAPSPTTGVVSSGQNDRFELSTGIGMAHERYVALRLSGCLQSRLKAWRLPERLLISQDTSIWK